MYESHIFELRILKDVNMKAIFAVNEHYLSSSENEA